MRVYFEELPSYRSHDGLWSGLHDGYAEIGFDSAGEWFIEAIHLKCDNRKFGKEAAAFYREVSVSHSKETYFGLLSALEHFYADDIRDRVFEEDEDRVVSRLTLQRAG